MFRQILLVVVAIAVTAAIAIAAMRQTEDLPPVGPDIWLAAGAGFVGIVITILLLLWVQLRRRDR